MTRREDSVPVRDGQMRDNFAVEAGFQCAGCGEWNSTQVDESAGRSQSYIEDCQVCCKPNILRVTYDKSSEEFFITAELE
jgi:cysteine-rich CPXCG protein